MNNTQTKDLPQLFQSIKWEGENTLAYMMRTIILAACLPVVKAGREVVGKDFELKIDDVKIEHPKVENYGDYSTNVALILASKVGTKPQDLAEKIANELNNYIKQHQSITSLTDSLSLPDKKKSLKITEKSPKTVDEMIEGVSVARPGFINLTIRKDYLITYIQGVLKEKNGSITTKSVIQETGLPLTSKKFMVEFAHPNTHKEFHIGHLRNISIGESIIRTLESVGAKLFRANYEGDVGLHVAKAIWGTKLKIKNEKLKIQNLRELNPASKAKFLGEGYALGNKMYDENETVKKEIIDLNKAIYQNPKSVELWEETRRWSLEYFEIVYYRLGSHFDRYYFESEVEAMGKQMVIDGVAKGIFIKDKDGSIYFPGKKYGLNNCVFVTRENYATYEGKDIAVESMEYKEFPFDLDIHVVAHEQRNFFQIAFKALEVINPIQKGRQYHLAYGMVNLKGGKLSSRTGQVITADWLVDEAKKKIREIIQKSTKTKDTSESGKATKTPRGWQADPSADGEAMTPPTVEETEQIAEKVAVAAVKYSMLKVNPKMDIAFDLEESVSLEGDSGPYLLYTYARCKSVIKKWEVGSGKWDKEVRSGENDPTSHFDNLASHFTRLTSKINPEELSLLRTLYRFPEVVTESARTLSPNLICTFLFDLAQKYNLFYNKHSILTPISRHSGKSRNSGTHPESSGDPGQARMTSEFRLSLTSATARIINSGLFLLGIETVERM